MTQISYIHGIGADERKDRAALVPGQSFIDYTAMTDGELRLTLLADQVNMLAAYYPEDKDLQKAKALLVDTLYKGLHRSPLPGGIHTGTIATVVKEIRFAQDATRPAAGQIFGRVNGIGGGIGDPLIPYEDCNIYQENEYGEMKPTGSVDPSCIKNNNIKKILNDNLEKSSHHLLYEFVANPNSAPQTVAIKTQSHRAAKATLSKISKLSQDNMRLWMRNGIIRQNTKRGAGAIQPEPTIQIFKENAGVSGIGVVPAIVPILQAVVAAIAAIATLVAALKQKDPQTAALWAQLQGIGTGVYGPEGTDWTGNGPPPPGGSGGATGEGQDYLPILLLGGAAVLLMK